MNTKKFKLFHLTKLQQKYEHLLLRGGKKDELRRLLKKINKLKQKFGLVKVHTQFLKNFKEYWKNYKDGKIKKVYGFL